MINEHVELAKAAGCSWARKRAEALLGSIPALNWPESWDPRWAGALPTNRTRLSGNEMRAMMVVANEEAAERWSELVSTFRRSEDLEDEEHDLEAEAVKLVEAIRRALPPGLQVDHDGGRVFLIDDRGAERTVSSAEDAARVIHEFLQVRSLLRSA